MTSVAKIRFNAIHLSSITYVFSFLSPQHGPLPLAWHIDEAVAGNDLARIEKLIAHVESHGPTNLVHVTRNFGEHKQQEGGHRMTYLHEDAESQAPGLIDLLWGVASQADDKAGWGVSLLVDKALASRPAVRCIEAIEYFAPATKTFHINKSHSLGWHTDGHTLLTMAVMLSSPHTDFSGGEFEMRRGTSGSPISQHIVLAPGTQGDVTVWRGWDEHRVRPILSGLRRVLVVEWWIGKEVSNSGFPRAKDYEAGYKFAVSVDPLSVSLHNRIGHWLKGAGFVENATRSYKIALSIEPCNAQSHNNLGVIYERRNETGNAEQEYILAMTLDPKSPVAYNNLAGLRLLANDTEGAMSITRTAINADPLDATAVRNLGLMQRSLKFFAEARATYAAALKLDPGSLKALLPLGELAEDANDFSSADAYFEAAVRANPGSDRAQRKLDALRHEQFKQRASVDWRAFANDLVRSIHKSKPSANQSSSSQRKSPDKNGSHLSGITGRLFISNSSFSKGEIESEDSDVQIQEL